MSERIERKITVPYVSEDGQDLEAVFNITFISNRMIEGYNEINRTILRVQDAWQVLGKIENDLLEGTRKAGPEIEKEITEQQDLINGSADEAFFKKRYELLCAILRRNKVKDETFLSFDFWHECVMPDDIIMFLREVIFKDVEPGKVVKGGSSTLHYDRLISALNKYWRAVSNEEFWDEMDLIDTNNAVAVAGFPEHVTDWVWTKKRVLGEVY